MHEVSFGAGLIEKGARVTIRSRRACTARLPEAAAKVRYVLNLYAGGLTPADTWHRDLVTAVFEDFAQLAREG
jgi:hypothetical protein